MPNPSFHSSNLREFRKMEQGDTFFVTKCVSPREPVLAGETAGIISDSLLFYAEKQKIFLAAYVVMPDHWHALIASPTPLPRIMASLQSWINRSNSDLNWQDGYYETLIRSSRQFSYTVHYIENNPVKNNLTSNKEDWKYSSANPINQRFLTRPWPWIFER
jgi:REP element-mobilizing transposase RayT